LLPSSPAGEPIGIITIEDVLEELMGQEILDETDQFVDNERRYVGGWGGVAGGAGLNASL
jgi:CBS domain containing-hemolysin-like protein